ncbi:MULTISPECIES: Fic family protein [Oceanobacillus]|uniref:Fic family protein n=1 Tax=Oceanobacillus TaxID=182709 RepID=UPI0009884DE9|nr:Fic family protein [Oceanobacillus sojae]MCT1904603.1 Fic family protein [Oceanobacillus sojae]
MQIQTRDSSTAYFKIYSYPVTCFKIHKQPPSALNHPKQSVFGEDAYPALFTKCAALCHSLITNHPFYSGNCTISSIALSISCLVL